MKKLFYLFVITLLLGGCATANQIVRKSNAHTITLGMTKDQVYERCGPPVSWTRQVINGKRYETYFYETYIVGNYDFVDGILVGYSQKDMLVGMKYYSADGVENSSRYKQR